jgi:hypothetical protein
MPAEERSHFDFGFKDLLDSILTVQAGFVRKKAVRKAKRHFAGD